MKTFLLTLIMIFNVYGQYKSGTPRDQTAKNVASQVAASTDTVSQFIRLLNDLALNSNNPFFKQHCGFMINVLQAKELSEYEISFVKKMYTTFSDTNILSNASRLLSYTERKRPFIISWTSPADSVVSLAWLLLPQNWDPEKSYPLYVTLHGLYDPYSNPVEYMARYLSPDLIVEKSFEDGYSLFPWGRGNIWYEGIGETDVWESITAVEKLIKVDSTRKYLTGHSMGGYGAWGIGQKSAGTWAALGIYAGALWYNNNNYLTTAAAQNLKDVPAFFVCGTQDGLLGVNQTAHQLLQTAGNTNLAFVTFPGGHEALLENWQKMYEWVRNFTIERKKTCVRADAYQIPACIALFPNYPNPFNPTTTIEYQIPNGGTQYIVSLRVYDMLSREVTTLVDGVTKEGYYTVTFDAHRLASGIYFARCTASSQDGNVPIIKTIKMLMVK
ncbi:MAG: T9SS type A sorting domain-containing protein [Ignavibacteriales bacterium]|nr:T9SS type A sorting domain-containing protein [Ignavibacteriales bacterium]